MLWDDEAKGEAFILPARHGSQIGSKSDEATGLMCKPLTSFLEMRCLREGIEWCAKRWCHKERDGGSVEIAAIHDSSGVRVSPMRNAVQSGVI